MKPIVAIVGRPNVGKSMLFNKLIGRRLSIVEDTPGVTRDRIYGETDWNGRAFTLIDTGGIEPRTDDQILTFMRQQAQLAIDHATVIIFLTDVRTGLTASDHEVAGMLLRSGKPIVLAVNKMDSTGAVNPDFYEFYNLGLHRGPSGRVREILPAGGGSGGGRRRHQGGSDRKTQRGQVLSFEPDSGGGAEHCQRCGGYHPGCH